MSLQGVVVVHLKTSINISHIETLFILFRMYKDELTKFEIAVMLDDLFQHHNSILVLKLY